VNAITNRKQAISGKLSGKTPEEKKKQWYTHFKNLLSTPLADASENSEIAAVLRDLEMTQNSQWKSTKKQKGE